MRLPVTWLSTKDGLKSTAFEPGIAPPRQHRGQAMSVARLVRAHLVRAHHPQAQTCNRRAQNNLPLVFCASLSVRAHPLKAAKRTRNGWAHTRARSHTPEAAPTCRTAAHRLQSPGVLFCRKRSRSRKTGKPGSFVLPFWCFFVKARCKKLCFRILY